jgi:hypothetical protein
MDSHFVIEIRDVSDFTHEAFFGFDIGNTAEKLIVVIESGQIREIVVEFIVVFIRQGKCKIAQEEVIGRHQAMTSLGIFYVVFVSDFRRIFSVYINDIISGKMSVCVDNSMVVFSVIVSSHLFLFILSTLAPILRPWISLYSASKPLQRHF